MSIFLSVILSLVELFLQEKMRYKQVIFVFSHSMEHVKVLGLVPI